MKQHKRNLTKGRGRPTTAHQLRIVPVPHSNPDPRKLGRALLALALHQAQEDAAENDDHDGTSDVKEVE